MLEIKLINYYYERQIHGNSAKVSLGPIKWILLCIVYGSILLLVLFPNVPIHIIFVVYNINVITVSRWIAYQIQ